MYSMLILALVEWDICEKASAERAMVDGQGRLLQ